MALQFASAAKPIANKGLRGAKLRNGRKGDKDGLGSLPQFLDLLRIPQQELGYLAGLSRQRVNQALLALQSSGVVHVEYGGVRVVSLDGLRTYRAGDNC